MNDEQVRRAVALDKRLMAYLQVYKRLTGTRSDSDAVHQLLRLYLIRVGILQMAQPFEVRPLTMAPLPIPDESWPSKKPLTRTTIRIHIQLARLIHQHLQQPEGIMGCYTLAEVVRTALRLMFIQMGIMGGSGESVATTPASSATSGWGYASARG